MTKVTVIGGIKSISYPGAHRSFASSTLRSQFGIKTTHISAGRLQFPTQSVSQEIRSRSLGDNRIKTVSRVLGGLTSENGFIFDIFHGEDIPKEQANTSSNVGPGVGLALPKNGVDLPFKSLVAGTNVTITDNPDHVVIESQDTGEANTSSNTGPGVGLALPKNGIDLPFKSLVAGTNVTLTDNPDHVVIESQDTGEANTSSNAGTGVGLALPKNGVDLPFKSLVSGKNISIISNSSDATIGLSLPAEFESGDPITTSYSAAKGVDLFVNGTALLGNTYNIPAQFIFDPIITPNLPGSFRYDGYRLGSVATLEFMPVDPNRIYRLSAYIRQQGLPGDWSSYTYGERHRQYMGLKCYDIDLNEIISDHHKRYKSGGVDSLTTLTQPLTPGDTQVHVADATGWNNGEASMLYFAGLSIYEYKNSFGFKYDYYSRIYQRQMWDAGGVDKTNHIITLNQPFPAALGNPDDPNGTWPVGTRVANQAAGGVKYALLSAFIVPLVDKWYRTTNYIGAIDISGTDNYNNFPPGTAYVKYFFAPNDSNAAGGISGFPDTGPNHSVWFAGISLVPEPLGVAAPIGDGSYNLKIPEPNIVTGQVDIVDRSLIVEEI